MLLFFLQNTNWINLTQLEQIAMPCPQFKSYGSIGIGFYGPEKGHMAFIIYWELCISTWLFKWIQSIHLWSFVKYL